MTIIFCLFKYFPYGGLQRDFLRIALECQRRGAKIIVYTLAWEGPVPDGFDIHIVPVRAFRNHRRVKKFSEWIEAQRLKGTEAQRQARGIGHEALENSQTSASEQQSAIGNRASSAPGFANAKQRSGNPQPPTPNPQSPTSNPQSSILIVGFNKMPGLDMYFAADSCFAERIARRNMFCRILPRVRTYLKFESAVFAADSSTFVLMIAPQQVEDFRHYYSIPPDRFVLLPPGMTTEFITQAEKKDRAEERKKLSLADDNFLLLHVGSAFKTKGVDRGIKAFAALPACIRGKSIYFIAGDGAIKSYQRLARKRGVEDRVIFGGVQTDIPALMSAADLLIHPARNEAAGMVLLESLICGLPVLCSKNCGYAPYIRDADAGIILHEPFSQQELNRQLEMLLKNNELLRYRINAEKYVAETNLTGMHEEAADAICKEANRAILNRRVKILNK
ncbi:MAG: glycosyltransferase [Kiritimatiellales bacterium]